MDNPMDEAVSRRRRYEARLRGTGPASVAHRFLIGPAGSVLINTPVYLLPGRINLQPKHRVLDLQGGRGALARILAARVPFHTPPVMIDTSPAALALAYADADPDRPIDLLAARPQRLPFADECFDLVIAAHVFRRLDDTALYLCLMEIVRVLRPGGVLVAWDYAPRSSRLLNRLHERLLAGDPTKPHLRGFGALAHWLSEAGFDEIQRTVLPPFLFPPIPHTALLAQKWAGRPLPEQPPGLVQIT